jgi:hypothetical protein
VCSCTTTGPGRGSILHTLIKAAPCGRRAALYLMQPQALAWGVRPAGRSPRGARLRSGAGAKRKPALSCESLRYPPPQAMRRSDHWRATVVPKRRSAGTPRSSARGSAATGRRTGDGASAQRTGDGVPGQRKSDGASGRRTGDGAFGNSGRQTATNVRLPQRPSTPPKPPPAPKMS